MTIEKISPNDTISRVVDAVNELIDSTDYIQGGFATDVVQDAVNSASVVVDQGLVDISNIKASAVAETTAIKDDATAQKDMAEAARDAAMLSRGVFASTADALSKGVNQLSITGNGSGGNPPR